MIIHYLVGMSKITNCKSEQLDAIGTLDALLQQLSDKYGADFRKAVYNREKNKLGEDVAILVNGKNAALSEGLETVLKDSDTIVILPSIMGG